MLTEHMNIKGIIKDWQSATQLSLTILHVGDTAFHQGATDLSYWHQTQQGDMECAVHVQVSIVHNCQCGQFKESPSQSQYTELYR